jgi:hypothetical protein
MSNEKIRKIKHVTALDGHHTIFTHNNQPKTCGWDGGDEGEEVQPRGSTAEVQYHLYGDDRVGQR